MKNLRMFLIAVLVVSMSFIVGCKKTNENEGKKKRMLPQQLRSNKLQKTSQTKTAKLKRTTKFQFKCGKVIGILLTVIMMNLK